MVGEIPIELDPHARATRRGASASSSTAASSAGDTLFLEGCGRTDLPGGDPAALYDSLTHKLAKIPDDAVLFPGHLYSAEPSPSMADTRRWNYVFTPEDAGAVARHVRLRARTGASWRPRPGARTAASVPPMRPKGRRRLDLVFLVVGGAAVAAHPRSGAPPPARAGRPLLGRRRAGRRMARPSSTRSSTTSSACPGPTTASSGPSPACTPETAVTVSSPDAPAGIASDIPRYVDGQPGVDIRIGDPARRCPGAIATS